MEVRPGEFLFYCGPLDKGFSNEIITSIIIIIVTIIIFTERSLCARHFTKALHYYFIYPHANSMGGITIIPFMKRGEVPWPVTRWVTE